MSLLIKNVTIADQTSAFNGKTVDILVENNTISQIDAAIPEQDGMTVQDLSGKVLMPGWVSFMADYSDPGYEHKETILTGLESAAAGGFTEAIIVPNTNPTLSNKTSIQYVKNQGKLSSVNIYPLGAISKQLEGKDLAEMMEMKDAGAVGFTDGWSPLQNPQLLLKALEYTKAIDATVVQIPVLKALSDGLMNEGENSVRFGMMGIPTIAETIMIYRDIELLRYTGSKLHIAAVSTAEGLELIRKAKAEGLNLTCSVTPYHLFFTDDMLEDYDSLYKVNPPLRSKADQAALIAGLEDGTIDFIATHHKPQDWDAKTVEFEYAKSGMATQEVTFSMLQAAAPSITDEKWAALLSTNITNQFGLPSNQIAVGKSARFTVVDKAQTWVVTKNQLKSKAYNVPFMGQELKGKASILIGA